MILGGEVVGRGGMVNGVVEEVDEVEVEVVGRIWKLDC